MGGLMGRVGGTLWRVLPGVLLIVLLLLTVVWFWPNLPYAHQDSAWGLALNQAVTDRMAFGRDIIYPLGPWGNIYAGQYHPGTDRMTLAGGALLALALSIGLLALGGRRWVLLLVPLLAATVGEHDAVFVFTPLLTLVLAVVLARPAAASSAARWRIAALLLLTATCGMLILVKGSFATQTAPLMGLTVLALLLGRRFGLAAGVAVGFVAAVAGFWLAAGQRLADLPAYLVTMLAVVNGYAEGLALDGPTSHIAVYLAVAAVLFWLVWRDRTREDLGGTAVLGLGLLLTLFLAFKSGFVRHDEHALIAGGTLALVPLALLPVLRGRSLATALLVTFSALAFISAHYPGYGWPSAQRGGQRLALSVDGAWRRLTEPGWLPWVFDAYMTNARTAMPLPPVEGPSDIYSSNQMALLANHLQWSPRPALQSVTVLGDVLAKADFDHLQGTGGEAPVENVFYRVDNEDNRLPSTQDGTSWPALLGAFHVDSFDRGLDTAVLRRIPGATPPAPGATLVDETGRIGAEVPLPAFPGGIAWATLDIRPTLAGRLVAFLFRPPLLTATIHYADGTAAPFRLVSALARLGFVLSPRIRNTEEMLSILLPERRDPGLRPVSITITGQSGTRWLWQPDYSVRLQALDIPVQEQVRAMLTPTALTPAPGPAQNAGTADACSVELINGKLPSTKPFTAKGLLELSGWSVISGARGEAPERVLIQISDARGQTWTTVADSRPRIDIAGFFVKPALSAAGFDARFDISSLAGAYTLSILAERGGKTWRCAQTLAIEVPG